MHPSLKQFVPPPSVEELYLFDERMGMEERTGPAAEAAQAAVAVRQLQDRRAEITRRNQLNRSVNKTKT